MTRDRGQTQQDFAVGISVFLLAVLFVFAFLPSTLASSGADIERGGHTADRVASAVFENVTSESHANELNDTRARQFFSGHDDGADIRANYSLAPTTNVNVTLETLEGITYQFAGPTVDATAGDVHLERVGATSTRIVRLGDARYRLVVRVW